MSSNTLPAELITEILVRLPVKPLLRFKSVSKSWYFLIKSPDFIKLHLFQTLTTTRRRHVIISYTTLSSADIHDLSFSELDHPLKPLNKEETLNYFPDPTGIDLLGHSNGVVCAANATRSSVYLYCPATRSRRVVPPSHISYPEDYVVFGLGYDDGADDFKVLRIIQCREKHCHVKFYNEAKVYSLKGDCWKWANDMPYFLVYKNCHGVFVKQGLHYVVVADELDHRFKFIARFDIRTEKFSLMELPEYEDEFGVSKLVLRELGGCLCVMVNYRSGLCADLWVMKDYGKKESWVRVLSLEIRPRFSEVRPVVFSDDERSVLLLIDNCELQWCELEAKDDKRVKIGRGSSLLDEPFDAGVYVDSLVSLDDWGVDSPTKQKNKNDLDDFLSVGFKLRL